MIGMALAMAAMLAIVAVRYSQDSAPVVEPVIAEIQHVNPTQYVRMVTSGNWAGSVQKPSPEKVLIEMTRGFAVVDFTGGHGRTLEIRGPGAVIEVVGTRFYVEIPPEGQSTIVGVAHGKVRVRGTKDTDLLEAGASREYPLEGSARASNAGTAGAYFTDEFLTEPVVVAPAPVATPVAAPRAEPPPSLRKLFARAEALARRGKSREALAIYRGIAESSNEAEAPFRAIARYEMARLLGFSLRQPKAAERIFTELVSAGDPEVAVEARFARCELDLGVDPCASAACLQSLVSAGPAAVTSEARQLLARWKIDTLACDDHKLEPVGRQKE